MQLYFNARGVVEAARICYAIKGFTYEDFRYPIDSTTWARPEFDADKAAGKFVDNMDRLPLLQVGETCIAQSKAIERFVAKTVGMMGSNDVEAAQIDAIGEHIRDIKDKYNDAKRGKEGDALEEAKKVFATTGLEEWLGKLEKALPGSSGFAVGSAISLADVQLFTFSDFFDAKDESKASFAKFSKISASIAAVESAAANWLATRPVTKI
jgi:glutathione S-transferase